MGPRKCEVCKEAQSKYKCPTCFTPYCSLPCFKKHKDIPCEKPAPSEEKTCPTSLSEKVLRVDEPDHLLQNNQLESIALSTEIRNSLKDEDIQKLIYKIDSSNDADNELDKVMELESFRKFTEKVLSVISTK